MANNNSFGNAPPSNGVSVMGNAAPDNGFSVMGAASGSTNLPVKEGSGFAKLLAGTAQKAAAEAGGGQQQDSGSASGSGATGGHKTINFQPSPAPTSVLCS
jgi:hypothetical protein